MYSTPIVTKISSDLFERVPINTLIFAKFQDGFVYCSVDTSCSLDAELVDQSSTTMPTVSKLSASSETSISSSSGKLSATKPSHVSSDNE